MHDMNLEKYRSKIQTAYKASPFTKGIFPEPEDAVKRFESRYAPIPAEYRWLLLNLESGRVQGYNCDYSDLEEIANSFSSLILSLVEQALEIGKLCGES